MDRSNKFHDDQEKVIERDETDSLEDLQNDPEVITTNTSQHTLRSKLDVIIHSHRFMVGVIVLVVLDCLLVLAELLFDLEIVKLHEDLEYVPKIFHYMSIAVLCVFMIEISVRIYVLRCEFFKHKLEVFDAIIVVVSFVLDVVFQDNEDATTGVGLLVLLRLWRITRIVNGIVMSVKTEADEKVEKERHKREECEQELAKCKVEIEALKDLLKEHNIEFPESSAAKPYHEVSLN